ncbi:MAG: hypothetical protein JW384_03771 [Nitrosomonadaceae bacterium]|nr:hypothetical protein [Nitrosomonadaceae bacterium]
MNEPLRNLLWDSEANPASNEDILGNTIKCALEVPR